MMLSTPITEISAVGSNPFTYQWRKNAVAIDTAANPTAAAATLALARVGPADAASYDCIVSNSCGAIISNAAALTICPSDFNCDRTTDFFDYLDFVEALASTDRAADFNNDGDVNFLDYLDFLQAFAFPC